MSCFEQKLLNESCNFSLALRIGFAAGDVVAAEKQVEGVVANANLYKLK